MERGLQLGTCILRSTFQLPAAVNLHSRTIVRHVSVWRAPFNAVQKSCFPKLINNENQTKFHSLEPKRRNIGSGLSNLSKLSNFNLSNGFPKTLFTRSSRERKPKKKRVPKLILVQNPFTWLMTKIDFAVLRTIWDQSFREKDFKFGTRQAISRVTNVISDGQFAELNGLLTKPARSSLMRELERNWNDRQRSLLALRPSDIQISSPRKVYFIRIADCYLNWKCHVDSLCNRLGGAAFALRKLKPLIIETDKKYCDVDMAFLALKWAPINSAEALIFTEVFARFHREYTPHSIPEWTIAYFKVTRFQVLRRQ